MRTNLFVSGMEPRNRIALTNTNRASAVEPRSRKTSILEMGGVFAAFGALHLPGEVGVIELLRARGFEVTRLDG